MKCKCWFASIDSKWNRELMLLHRCHLPAAQLQCNATPLPSNPSHWNASSSISASSFYGATVTLPAVEQQTRSWDFLGDGKPGPTKEANLKSLTCRQVPPPFSCSIAQHTGLYKAYDWPSMNCSVYSQLCWTNLDTGGMCHRLCRQVKYPVLNCRVQLKVFEEKITKPLPTFPNFIACGYFVTRKV